MRRYIGYCEHFQYQCAVHFSLWGCIETARGLLLDSLLATGTVYREIDVRRRAQWWKLPHIISSTRSRRKCLEITGLRGSSPHGCNKVTSCLRLGGSLMLPISKTSEVWYYGQSPVADRLEGRSATRVIYPTNRGVPACPNRAFSRTGAAVPVPARSSRRRWRRSSGQSPCQPPQTRGPAPGLPVPRAAASRRTCSRPFP